MEALRLTKSQIVAELSRSTHGKLSEYLPVGSLAAKDDPEFFAHLIAWNEVKGQIRDSKVALPLVQLQALDLDGSYQQNALAHLALRDPRSLVQGLNFSYELLLPGQRRSLRRLVEGYLRAREANPHWWERTVLQHRRSMKTLYARYHIKPISYAKDVLFEGKKYGIWKALAELKSCSPQMAAGYILNYRIPFLIAKGALGKKLSDPDLVLALLEQITPNELMANIKQFEKLGVKTNPSLRSAFEAALARAADTKGNLLKAGRAAEVIEDEAIREKVLKVQEKIIEKQKSIEGRWLILADVSGSMQQSIEVARQVAATLVSFCKEEVTLTFFNETPRRFDVSGKSYEDIQILTSTMIARGGTNIGCGLRQALDDRKEYDGIVVITDGGENQGPRFDEMYKLACQKWDNQPPIYIYHVDGEYNELARQLKACGIEFQQFDLGPSIDYYSLPNLVQTMRASRYSLVEEIMTQPLLKLEDVLKA